MTLTARKLLLLLTGPVVACLAFAAVSIGDDAGHSGSIPDFENRLIEVNQRLDQLASLSLQSGVGSIGFRSLPMTAERTEHWIQVDWKVERKIDQVVLVPIIWRDTRQGYIADAFPAVFQIKVISSEEPRGRLVASIDQADGLLPRTAPVIVVMPEGTVASQLRVEVLQLSPRTWDGRYALQLAEILVFSGEENVALGGEVTTSFPQLPDGGAHSKSALTDGFLPYLMDAATGEQSLAPLGNLEQVDPAVIEFDLGEAHRLSWIHLHRIDLNDSVPQAVPTDFAIPSRILIEGANESDFSDAQVLIDYRKESVFDAGPIIARRFREKEVQYVRLSALEPYQGNRLGERAFQIGFAEVEIFTSDGTNVAKQSNPKANFAMVSRERSVGGLVDGRNFYGDIISIREWMNQLAERHDLETERPRLVAELGQRYELQKANLRRLGWLVAFVSVSAVIIILVYRILQMRRIGKIRERLAADLHDELGANLHTIGLLSNMAAQSENSPEELAKLNQRIRSETERSGVAVRHCADMLEAGELYIDLVGDMKRAARRILAKSSHRFEYEGEEFLTRLRARDRADLFLFYNESLVNAGRHSGASEFVTKLKADKREVCLSVCDNGHGIRETGGDNVPPSLLRRAKLVGGKVWVDTSEAEGTRINLKLKIPRWSWKA